MSKVIIDNHLIDLECVTRITLPYKHIKTTTVEFIFIYSFTIHFIGNSSITINRANTKEGIASITKMYNELAKRWSPSMIKFDDITVK